MMLLSLAMSRLVESLSALSPSTLDAIHVVIVVVVVVVVVVAAAVLCHTRRRRRRQDADSAARRSPTPCVSSSSKTGSPDGVDCWLRTAMEWAWSRRHVTWTHVARCGVDAWMTALTEQARRLSVGARAALQRSRLPAVCLSASAFQKPFKITFSIHG